MRTETEVTRSVAEDTFMKHLEYLSSGRIDEWMGLWNENGILEFPFKLPVYPEKVIGLNAIKEYVRHFPEYLEIKFSKPSFHRTEDPNLVIAEFNGQGIMKTTGLPYNQAYISVVYTSNGKIDHYKDFWNPLVALNALGPGNHFAGAIANM